ncbi:MAG: DUF3788 domain-containing protein [Lachnospiraceae bacterium]|nr:DUF3788 domain-containing protein [Lachnospiraceae bacterium]
MYERMLNKQVMPTIVEMTEFCGENGECFSALNAWLTSAFHTEQKIVFPYGNKYGWGISHKKKSKLICNVFAEDNAFTVMVRLSDKQYSTVYDQLRKDTQESIDNKYPCGDGGWIHYRITCREHFDDIKTLLSVKCSS